jgi:ADP-ribose pyrophosphatase YjhB (NUDIX family)
MQEAIVREVKEETNLDVRAGDMVLVHDSIPPDFHRHIVNVYFMSEVVGGDLRVGQHDKRLRDLEYLPLTELPKVEMYPAIGEELLMGIRNGFADCPRYLGNLWVEEE